jgi:hypothetical protein
MTKFNQCPRCSHKYIWPWKRTFCKKCEFKIYGCWYAFYTDSYYVKVYDNDCDFEQYGSCSIVFTKELLIDKYGNPINTFIGKFDIIFDSKISDKEIDKLLVLL